MSTQVITRFDLVNTNRLRYLSYFSSSTPETRVWGEAFSSYAEAALPTTIAGVSRIPIDYVMDKYGRYHASTENYRGLSLQRMDKRVRNWICAPHVQDIDVVNAAPTVLKQVYDQAGCDTSLLTFFVDNYESSMDHLREVGFTGDKAKMVKNWMLFGYGYGVEGIPDWVTDIRKELRNGRGIMYEKYSDLHAIAIDRDEEKREKFQAGEKKRDREGNRKRYQNNAEGIFLSLLYQRHEGQILRAMDEAGREFGIWDTNIAWIHDGIMAFPTHPIRDVVLREIESHIKKSTCFSVILKIKPTSDCLTLDITKFPKPITIHECDHFKAAKIVELGLGQTYVRDRGQEYTLRDGIWSRSKEAVTLHLQRVTVDMDIRKIIINPKTEEEKIVAFTSMNQEMLKTVSFLRTLLQDPTTSDFARDVVLGGVQKLAFKDGYYQFGDTKSNGRYGRFIKGGYFNTFCRVDSYFPERIEENIEFVYKEIIKPMFQNSEDGLMELFLTALARAMAGCTDKITYILHGPRNSGKSVLFQLMDNAFGMYVRTIPSGVFAVTDGSSGDAFRQNGFMIDAELARIIKMSELPPTTSHHAKVKIDGSKIKSFQSMKEGIVARGLYMSQRPYYSIGTGFFLMNDIPEFSPSDAMDRCHLFELPNEFVSEKDQKDDPFNSNKKIANPQIEEWIRDKKYTDAMIHIVLDSFSPAAIVPLPSMIQCKEDVMTGLGDEQYLSVLEITMDRQDKIVFPEIKIALEKSGIRDNVVAMGRVLKRIVENEFKKHEKPVPDVKDIKRVDRQRKSPTFNKQFYHYMRLRTIYDRVEIDTSYKNGRISNQERTDGIADDDYVGFASKGYETMNGASYGTGFIPGRGN